MSDIPRGATVGGARGSVTVDASQLNAARAAVRDFATGVNTDLTGINRGAQDAERGFSRVNSGARNAGRGVVQLRDATQDLAASFGIVASAAGIIRFGRFVVAADALATAYRRQNVAAVSLAGSQERLNVLLEAYERASGGTVDRARALSDVTRLQAVGFADSGEELERFVRATRGASLAMGTLQDRMSQEIQLAISNQSLRRLDQIGLGISEVNDRITQLRANNAGMTREAAFQEAILGLLNEKFGALADSTAGAATGAEQARRAFADVRLEFGELTGPFVGFAASGIANWLRDATRDVIWLKDNVVELAQSFGLLPRGPLSTPPGIEQSDRLMISRGGRMASRSAGRTPEQISLIRDWADSVRDIERSANRARIDATRQYEEQRTDTIRDYERTIAREAEDFARSRARAEQEFAASIVDIREDAARREADAAEDLTRATVQARADTDEQIADLRADTTARLVELEEDYQRDRERAATQHRDNLLSAASRLDARAVAEEQRRFARESRDAAEAHEEQRSDLEEALAERIRDEEESLEKSNRLRQENYDRQIREQRENDERRIQDMRDDFAQQQRIEDEDRAVRLGRMAVDHQDQLAEQARQHGLRLEQIARQASEEREQLDEEFQRALDEQGMRIDGWVEQQERLTERAIQNFDKWWDHVNRVFAGQPLPSTGGATRGLPEMIPSFQQGGFVPRDMLAYLHAGERVTPAGASGGMAGMQVSFAAGAFQFHGIGGDPMDLERAVYNAMTQAFERLS